MGLLDSLLSFVGLGGNEQGSSGSGGGMITSWFNNMVNAGLDSLGLSQHGRDQYFNREMYFDALHENQDFQREMTVNQQDFTREMYNQQWSDMLSKYPWLSQQLNNQQFNLWRNQFDLQNAWNEQMYQKYQSPKAVVSQNAAAGLNPAALNGVNNGVSANSMGGSSSAMPPQISPTSFNSNASPMGVPQGMSGRGDSIQEIGSFLKDVSEMQLNQKRIGRFDEQMDAQIKSALASAGLAESQTKYQELINSVDSFMLPHKKASEVKLNMALAAKASAEGDEAEANARLDDALTELNKTKNEEAKARLPFVEMEARAEIDEIRASAAQKRAEAKEAEQRTQTERYNTRIAEIRSEVDAKTKVSKIATLINDMRKQRVLNAAEMSQARLKLRRLQAIQRDGAASTIFNEVDAILNWLTSHIGVAINGNVSTSSSSSNVSVHKE